MNQKANWLTNKYIILLLLTGAVYFFLQFLCPLIMPILIAGVFLTLCYPTFDDIQKKTKIKKQYMASAILLLICAALIILVWWGGSYILQRIPHLIDGLNQAGDSVSLLISDCLGRVEGILGISVGDLENTLNYQIASLVENVESKMMPLLLENSWGYLKSLGSIIGVLAVTMIATILLAKDYDAILAFLGAREGSRLALEIILKVIRYMITFVKAQLVILLFISLVCIIMLSAAGVENSVAWGIVAGILDALPFIGTGIVLFPLALWQLISGAYLKAALCILTYVLCALIREFAEPRLIGKRVGVYPITILIAIYAGVRLFGISGIIKGPVGMILLWQSYTCICRYIDNKKPNEL